jgi:NitT/TauT family transport system substrate-binding protein
MRSITNGSRKTRRVSAVVSATALMLTLGACGQTEAPANEVVSLKIGSTTSLAGVGVRNGISSGQFTKEGLTVEAAPVKSGNDAVPQLISGDLQIAQVDTTTAMQAIQKGVPIKIVAVAGVQSTDGGVGVPSTGSVLVKPGSDIKTPADLAGRDLGIHAINSQIWMNIRAVIDADGGNSADTKFIEVPGPQAIDMLLKGEVEATTASEPLASASVAAGTVRLIHSTDIPGKKGEPSSVYVATNEFIGKNPESLKKFTTAVYAAQDEVNKDKELGKKIAVELLGYKEAQLRNAFILDYGTTAISSAQIDAVSATAVKYGILSEAPKASDVLADFK